MASALVRRAPQFEPPIRFVYVSLVEPPKAEVPEAGAPEAGVPEAGAPEAGAPEAGALTTEAAPRPARRVKAVLRSPSRRATYEVVVCLDDEAVISWQHLTGAQPGGNPADAG
jgi:Cu2+-containing amine oxidase